jgi:hypothetical protein
MSESIPASSTPNPTPTTPSDERVLAQVEKWMAMIRELSHEPSGEPKPGSAPN